MCNGISTFLIDSRFLLRNSTETFWGASLNVVDGQDSTFCFGFLRDLLRLRSSLRISAGVIVFGSDASSLATEKEVRAVVGLCRELGVPVVQEPKLPVLAIVAAHSDRFSDIVTDDRRMLRFCSEKRVIHLGTDPRSIERMTPDVVQRSLGVSVQHVPTYLALTEGHEHGHANSNGAQRVVTTREARRLVELHGALPGIYRTLSTMKSPALRKKLADNQNTFVQRYTDNTTSPREAPAELPGSLEWKLDGKEGETPLRERGFFSLIRMLALTDRPDQAQASTNDRIRASESYRSVLNCREFNELLERIAVSVVCALDTETDDKDPRRATLFGISFAVARGKAFFVPFCERDMGDLTPSVVRRGLRRLFKKQATKFVGHNLKYDFTLLRRNAIEPPPGCFDTLLAAYECYGDLDFFNLPFLAQKLLGRKIKAYKDIVSKEKTFLELPFEDMKEHACTDADVALQLHTFLEKEMKDRKIGQQFEERTMPLSRILLNLENDGIPVKVTLLEELRSRLVDGMLELRKSVSNGIGSEIDLDSQKDISILMTEKLGLRGVLGKKSLTQSLLEQLAPQQPLLKLVVEYKRRGKQLRRVESIIKAIRRGRIYPLFSQTGDGRISSTNPDLFADDGLERLCECIGGEPAVWLQDKRRSLEQVQQASGDLVLKKDRTGPRQVNLFMNGQTAMDGVDHDDFLLRVLIGESSHRLSTRFLLGRLTVNNILHALEVRYRRAFHYIADVKAQGLKQGYVEREGLRRYFDGLRSSSIEKRNLAQVRACRWLLQY
jgi:DNA polymerase I-like protein with 3'-5' exonuclease and polymerase domains